MEFLFKPLSKKTAGLIVSIVIIRQNMKKGLRNHIWKMHELSQNSAKEICAENISANCETFKCELCDKEAHSEPELKVHKAKWHTNVAPYYRNITRILAYREIFQKNVSYVENNLTIEQNTSKRSMTLLLMKKYLGEVYSTII